MSYRILLALVLVSNWPIWIWYAQRMTDHSDEPWGILALIATSVFIPWKRLSKPASPACIGISIGLLLVTQVFLSNVYMLIQASLLAAQIALILWYMRAPVGLSGLLFLSLPWLATLQFYCGFPLRIITGEATRWLLILVGFHGLEREGVSLFWNHELVMIDRPCAGIHMLWFGTFFTYILATLYRLNLHSCIQLSAGSFLVLLSSNVLRNFLLFFTETGRWQAPAFAHDAIGVFFFTGAIYLLVQRAEASGKKPCQRTETLERHQSFAQITNLRLRFLIAFAFVLSIIRPLVSAENQNTTVQVVVSPLWPQQFMGEPIYPLPLSEKEVKFYGGFPGQAGQFVNAHGERLIFRMVEQPTRKLHPARDCFRGLGYTVKETGLKTDLYERIWESFEATGHGNSFSVMEAISDNNHNRWTDVSAWYWSTLLNRTKAPWQSVIWIRPLE